MVVMRMLGNKKSQQEKEKTTTIGQVERSKHATPTREGEDNYYRPGRTKQTCSPDGQRCLDKGPNTDGQRRMAVEQRRFGRMATEQRRW